MGVRITHAHTTKRCLKVSTHMVNLHPQLFPKYLSNYRKSCSFKSFRVIEHWLAFVSDILVYKCLIYQKSNKQQLQSDLSCVFQGYTVFLKHSNWLWTLSDTHSRTDSFLQMAWLHAGGDQKPFTPTKAFFLLHPRPRHAAGGTPWCSCCS